MKSTREKVGGFLDELGARLGVRLSLDEDGVCSMEYGEGREVVVEVDEDDVIIYLPLTAAPEAGREAFFERALALNLLGVRTRGCALGYDGRDERLILSRSQPAADLDAVGFQNVLGGVLEVAKELREELEAVGPEADAAAPGEDASAPDTDAGQIFPGFRV